MSQLNFRKQTLNHDRFSAIHVVAVQELANLICCDQLPSKITLFGRNLINCATDQTDTLSARVLYRRFLAHRAERPKVTILRVRIIIQYAEIALTEVANNLDGINIGT